MLPLHFEPGLCYNLKEVERHWVKEAKPSILPSFMSFIQFQTGSETRGHNSITHAINRPVSEAGLPHAKSFGKINYLVFYSKPSLKEVQYMRINVFANMASIFILCYGLNIKPQQESHH